MGLLLMLILLALSALISGSEVAFFSLSPQDKNDLEQSKARPDQVVVELLDRPKHLLATILIANNFVNVAIIVLSNFLMVRMFNFAGNEALAFVIQVVVVTFLILLLGEILPKVYANRQSRRLAGFMSIPILLLSKLFSPLSGLLVRSTSVIDKRVRTKSKNISVDDLSNALELTTDDQTNKDEQKILEGIVKFGNTDVKQIMTSRLDVTALDSDTTFDVLIQTISESGFSRIPVYEEHFDKVQGLIYVKDLLPHIDENSGFDWSELVRPPFFVPENKKIDDLLKEFQEKKIHLAIVVDEYGGTSGVVTLEDIIEEIVGDISDEFDDDNLVYSKLDENNYVFEGKTPLNDLYRVLDIDGENFEAAKGESDTLAGFILELAGKIPKKNEKVSFENYDFKIEAADKRRIKRVKVSILEEEKPKASSKSKSGKSMLFLLVLAICGMAFMMSCEEEPPVPRPRGYLRLELPEHKYDKMEGDLPFSFEFSKEARLDLVKKEKDTLFFNVHYPKMEATIHMTYRPFENDTTLYVYNEDARELANTHRQMSDGIKVSLLKLDSNRVFGATYDFAGRSAVNYQFVVSDSSYHWMMGSLYFNKKPNPDSLAPVINYVEEDIQHLLHTLTWKNTL